MWRGKSGIRAGERPAPHPYGRSLHHCPHTRPWTACVGLHVQAERARPQRPADPFRSVSSPAAQGPSMPPSPPHSATATFDREDSKIMSPTDSELVSHLICPEAEADAGHGLAEPNRDTFARRGFARMCCGRSDRSCLITD